MPNFELETARLRLVVPTPQHLELYLATYGDAKVMTHLGGPFSLARCRQMLDTHITHWHVHGFGGWVVLERGSAATLGVIGLKLPQDSTQVEIGWLLRATAWGHGYAIEGAQAVLNYGFDTLGLKRVAAQIAHHNRASLAVAKKLGMTIDELESTETMWTLLVDSPDRA